VADSLAAIEARSTYHLISGSYTKKHLAKKQARSLKKMGFKPELMPKNDDGLIRVSVANFDKKAEALAALEEVKKKGVESWVLTITKKAPPEGENEEGQGTEGAK
jgi:cell division protein FtsN